VQVGNCIINPLSHLLATRVEAERRRASHVGRLVEDAEARVDEPRVSGDAVVARIEATIRDTSNADTRKVFIIFKIYNYF